MLDEKEREKFLKYDRENLTPLKIKIARVFALMFSGCFVLWLFSPAVQTVRSGRRPEVMNRMKHLALAQKNYAFQTDGQFCAPTQFNSKGEAVTGWYTLLLPYFDEGDRYSRIILELPYDHRANARLFKGSTKLKNELIPDFEKTTDQRGFGLIHFTINSRLFPESGPVTEEEIANSDGLGNTILMAEIQEGLPAWGAPGNARDPALGLKPGPNTMGVSLHQGSTVISYADGRAMTINNDIDPEVLKKLATPTGLEPIYYQDY